MHVVVFHSSDTLHSGNMASISCQHRHEAGVDVVVFDFAAFTVFLGNPETRRSSGNSLQSTTEQLLNADPEETYITVQAPHPPSAQPSFDPVNSMSSLRNDKRVWFDRALAATSSGTRFPLTKRSGWDRYPVSNITTTNERTCVGSLFIMKPSARQ